MPTYIHGKDTVVIFIGTNISDSTNSTKFGDDSDVHDVSCYGADRKSFAYGLGDGTITIGGVHASGAAGPRKVLKTAKANRTIGAFQFRPEGTGSGKAQSTVNVLVKNYTDTDPVAGMITWEATLQMSGALNEADQP